MKKDLNYIAKLEKAIAKKYGQESIQNPKAKWTDEKEKDYIEQLKKIYTEGTITRYESEKVEVNGFFVNKKLVNRDTNRNCPVCKKYSFDSEDDVYINKHECCSKCYIFYVHDREERWLAGWRPNKRFSNKKWYQKLYKFKYLFLKSFLKLKR